MSSLFRFFAPGSTLKLKRHCRKGGMGAGAEKAVQIIHYTGEAIQLYARECAEFFASNCNQYTRQPFRSRSHSQLPVSELQICLFLFSPEQVTP